MAATVDTDLARVPLAFALLTKRAALLARRRRGHGLRASLKSNAKLRRLGTHHRQASELCFKVAETLRTDGASGAHLRVARYLYSAIISGGSHSLKARAREKFILMLCQREHATSRDHSKPPSAKIRRQLRAGGFVCRLAPGILRYPRAPTPTGSNVPAAPQPRAGMACALDGALSSGMLAQLQKAFSPASPFWKEHSYACGVSPFFSYVHSLEGEPRTGFDRLLRRLRQRVIDAGFASVASARYAEWWAHCRPHGTGHQMHFDSDNEGSGGIRNPLASSALYLTAAGIGGPTLVTDQRRVGANSGMAQRGWLLLPNLNRYLIFDGKLLHGVVPGRGCPAPAGPSGAWQPNLRQAAAQGPELDAEQPTEQPPRRVSLMVAFWPHIRKRESERPGAAMPFPYDSVGGGSGASTWPALFDWPEASDGSPPEAQAVPLSPTSPVWQPTDAGLDLTSEMPDYDACFQGF